MGDCLRLMSGKTTIAPTTKSVTKNIIACGVENGPNLTKRINSERSRIISPALQQAVESSVAEIEEATFGRGNFFDIRDDIQVPEVAPQNEQEAMMMQMAQAQAAQEKAKIKYLRDKLTEDFKKAKPARMLGRF